MTSRIRFPANLDIVAVICLAVVPDVFRSIIVYSGLVQSSGYSFSYMHGSTIVRSLQVAVPILLIMHLRNVDWSEHGFTSIRPLRDLATAIGLIVASYAGYVFVYNLLVRIGVDFQNHADVMTSMLQDMSPKATIAIPVMLASSLANGFAEELAMRSYLIPRLVQLLGSKSHAVLITSALFGAYHLYQGPLGAAGIFVIGLVFGTYMATKQRFWPLFVAHSAMDLIPHLAYLQGLQDT